MKIRILSDCWLKGQALKAGAVMEMDEEAFKALRFSNRAELVDQPASQQLPEEEEPRKPVRRIPRSLVKAAAAFDPLKLERKNYG